MFTIPNEFKSNDYITIPSLKLIAKEVLPNKTFVEMSDKESLIQNIEEYANISDENAEKINNWLDYTVVEGIKQIHIKYIDDEAISGVNTICNDNLIHRALGQMIFDKSNMHTNNNYSEEYRLYRYDVENSDNGKVIKIYLGKLISHYDKYKSTSSNVPYPVFVEIYSDKMIVVARAKSKSNMYSYMDNFNIDKANSTTAEKELEGAIKYIQALLNISFLNTNEANPSFKNNLYYLLESVTETPTEIVDFMSEKEDEIENVVNVFMNDICCLDEIKYREDLTSNLYNLVEKYLSISQPDKSIFTKNKIAYPLKLDATDEEESKVTQTAAEEEPLQSKAIYFDNKKMLQKSKSCNDCTFVFYRKNKLYHGEKYKVKISTKQNYCILKFTEYTAEEDIKNVLFSFINIKQNIGTGKN